jgi:hypothetical protein
MCLPIQKGTKIADVGYPMDSLLWAFLPSARPRFLGALTHSRFSNSDYFALVIDIHIIFTSFLLNVHLP